MNVIETAPPARLVRDTVTAGCRYWSTDPVLTRRVIGLGTMHPEVQELIDGHDAGRLRLLRRLVDRLEGGSLPEECSAEQALNVLWVVTSFDAYDLLTRGRGLAQAEAAETLVRMAEGRLGQGASGSM